jgi:hypothetical protein
VNAICPVGVYNNQPTEFVKNFENIIPMGRRACVSASSINNFSRIGCIFLYDGNRVEY